MKVVLCAWIYGGWFVELCYMPAGFVCGWLRTNPTAFINRVHAVGERSSVSMLDIKHVLSASSETLQKISHLYNICIFTCLTTVWHWRTKCKYLRFQCVKSEYADICRHMHCKYLQCKNILGMYIIYLDTLLICIVMGIKIYSSFSIQIFKERRINKYQSNE